MDEPDAHLEFIRQKSIYNALIGLVNRNNSQLLVATHSEVILKKDNITPVALRDKNDSWWTDVKITDQFLDKVLRQYFEKTGRPVMLSKGSYYRLVLLAKKEEIDPEVEEKLTAIYKIASSIKEK
jgi:hypothetical protein